MTNIYEQADALRFLEAVAHGEASAIGAYQEWLQSPVTRALASRLEFLREADNRNPDMPMDGISRGLALMTAGARSVVWDRVYSLLFNFPTYAAATVPPAAAQDVAARPDRIL